MKRRAATRSLEEVLADRPPDADLDVYLRANGYSALDWLRYNVQQDRERMRRLRQ